MIFLQIICQETYSTFTGHDLCAKGKHLHFFLQIHFIFCCCACSKTDRISKIMHGKSRHNRIQVDHADSFSGLIIDHDVISLSIIVCHSKRKFFSCQYKFNLFLHRCCTSAHICFYSLFESLKPFFRIMKIRNGLMQCLSPDLRRFPRSFSADTLSPQ